MSSITSGLLVSAGALETYSQALQAVENNVANASTPGYAAQTQTLVAQPFDTTLGSSGGVKAGEMASSRDEYAEQAVWQQNSALGSASQNVTTLSNLQSLFDVTGNTGIPYALNNLFQSFSAWAQTPDDVNARQLVIDSATDVAGAFQDAAASLSQQAQNTQQQVGQTVQQVNQLVSQLQQYNVQSMGGGQNDAGLDAGIHSTLEQLSQYVGFTATKQTDGSWTVLLNGQTPLLVGSQQYTISASLAQPANPPPVNVNGPPQMEILASDGTDVTSQVTTGQLGSLLNTNNTVLASLLGSASQPGDLNTLAEDFAQTVNTLLTSGNVSDGPPPQTGVPLFTYDTANPTNVAQTLAVNPSVTADQLAAIEPGPPEVSNGIALALAQLATPQSSQDEINGQSYTEFYGNMAANVGSQLQSATNEQQVSQATLAQAQNLRQQESGVDLDQEAMTLLQYQRAYDANSRLITVLDQISEDAINIIGTTTA